MLLRLPHWVQDFCCDWLARCLPEQAARITGPIRETRDGRLNDSRFGHWIKGSGQRAAIIGRAFDVFCRRLGLDRGPPPRDSTQFQRPGGVRQLRQFPGEQARGTDARRKTETVVATLCLTYPAAWRYGSGPGTCLHRHRA